MNEQAGYPIIYEESKVKVLERLKNGEVEYMDLSEWSYQDRFFAFLLGTRFFEVCGASYPTPRVKEEIPVWFLLCCAVQMRMHTNGAYHRLPGILKNGPILSRVKFNVGGVGGGFNRKNRKARECPVNSDAVRKFFKDSDPMRQRNWHNQDVVKFYRHNRAFDKHGIFVLDQTHVVVPDNPNYQDAVRMPVDEHGQLLEMDHLSDEQKKALKYRSCYALSELVHIGKDDRCCVVAGYQWGPGNTDELTQGRPLVHDFVSAVGPGVMKVLIDDRGYVDGAFISDVKTKLKSDVVVPLKKNMDMYQEAVREVKSRQWEGKWTSYRITEQDDIRYTEEVACVDVPGIWEKCTVPLFLSIMRISGSDGSVRYWVLASTFKPTRPQEAFKYYSMRTTIEECHRQFKIFWKIGEFTSPNKSLVESQVLFTLMTYSLVQLHLAKKHLTDLTNKTIETLKREEKTGTNAVIVYHGCYFAVFDLAEYTLVIADLTPEAKERLIKWIEKSKSLLKLPSG